MKKLLILVALAALTGCAEKKPLTPEEQWQGYCKSVGNAARSILLDRQNGIEKPQAVEYAEKVEDETTKKFILAIIEKVYAMPANTLNDDVEASREKLRQEVTAECVATPFDKLPDYKPF